MRNIRRLQIVFLALILANVSCQAAAYPSTWTSSHLDAGYPAGVTCISHPTQDWGEHGAPTTVPITFTLTDSAGKLVNTICPGATYTITEKLAGSDSGHIFVTTTAGSLTPGEKPAGCKGARYGSANRAPSFTQKLTVGCKEATATDKIVVAVSYTTGTGGNYRQGSATFNINSACYQSACGGAPVPSPPPTQNSPVPGKSPVPSPSPSPSRCGPLPNVTGITWPATCSGKTACSATCRTGFAGGVVRATCVTISARSTWRVTGMCTCVSRSCGSNPRWGHWGGNLQNTRNAANEKGISPANVARLGSAWVFNTSGDVSATPTVVGNRLLVPDWGGFMYCLNADTGALIWRRAIIEYVLAVDPAPYPSGYSNSSIISRTSPAVEGNVMVFGVMKKGGGFPYLIAANITNGALLWGMRADPHPHAMITQSPTVYGGFVYVGVSSLEELVADSPDYECCTFIGNMIKVSLATGAVMWRTYMTPPNNNQTGGFSGNAVWGSSPALNLELGHVYIATGNNYEIPEVLAKCHQAVGDLTLENMQQHLACEAKYGQGNYHNCMIALDMNTGAVRWAKQLGGPDAWNAACLFKNNNESCPDINAPDFDFAQAPMLVNACKNGACKKLVVAGQKSGWVWALQPTNGEVEWSLQVGPGGLTGGLQWGSAADSQRIYVSNNNNDAIAVDLTKMKAVPNKPGATAAPTTTKGGLTAAVDAYDGTLLWTFANPTMHWDTSIPPQNARSQAPMTVANGVVYYASMDANGTLFYLEAATGRLLGSFETGATLGCGPSLARGKVFAGSGYLNFGLGQKGTKLHALKLK